MTGKTWKYGDDVNTDVIYPGRYTYMLISEQEMGTHALEDLDPLFNKEGAAGDIIVAGKNWGCGSAREQAVKCLKIRGVSAIIAKSFSRIYYRNSLNEGLLTVVCPEAVERISSGEKVSIDFTKSVITTNSGEFKFSPYPDFVKGLVENGGLLPYVKKTLREQGKLKD
ncbi:MAG TPA: 3-isopropylmalate dehydratase small subunit [Syntrophomonas sp.]|nr:3-isopropylmalate dehydratase small subunit [Syntrophomonas sp.]